MTRISKRKIQIFRKPVRFEKALLQTGAAFEHPRVSEDGVSIDATKYPTEDIVFLDDVWQQ